MAIEQGMITPFVQEPVKGGKISYGLSSYGYDFRIADEFKIFTGRSTALIDPKNFDSTYFIDVKDNVCTIPPNSIALGRSLEYFKIPRNILALCTGKSTYARCGIIVNVTPLEPEWEGFITVAIANTLPAPARIYAQEGLGQVIFLEAHDACLLSYKDKKGKYQKQQGIVLPKID